MTEFERSLSQSLHLVSCTDKVTGDALYLRSCLCVFFNSIKQILFLEIYGRIVL